MDKKILDKMLNIAEQFFGSADDSDQMPITEESFYKLQKLHPKTVIYKLENGEPVSWVVVLPTQVDLMDRFLKGEINERELLDLSKPQEIYEALYFCVAFTVPRHRRKGHALEMFKEAIESIPHTENVKLFAWLFSKEGGHLIRKLGLDLGKKIYIKNF